MNTSPQLMQLILLRLARRWVALTRVDIIGDSHSTAALPDVESREIRQSVHACIKLCQILQNKDDESEAQLIWRQMHFQVREVGVAHCEHLVVQCDLKFPLLSKEIIENCDLHVFI